MINSFLIIINCRINRNWEKCMRRVLLPLRLEWFQKKIFEGELLNNLNILIIDK
jgi:hypothetical protein